MSWDSFLGWFSVDMGIDLGTCNTLVCVRSEGIVLNEPSVVAVKRGTNKVLNNGNAVGWSAKEMLGKTPGSISAIRPLKDGVIADFDVTEAMLRYFIQKAHNRTRLVRPRIVICVPPCITSVEKRAVRESAISAGAREVYLMEEPMAAALGAGLNVTEPTGNMVIDVGGGTTDVAVISLAQIITSSSARVGGDKLDEAIINYVKRKHNLLIGERTAEIVKITIATVMSNSANKTMEIKGRDLVAGVPKMIVMSSDEVREALTEPIHQIIETVLQTLERTPPELAADIVDRGIVLVGGGALLRDFDQLLRAETKLPIVRAEDPFTAVALGAGKALDSLDLLREVAMPN